MPMVWSLGLVEPLDLPQTYMMLSFIRSIIGPAIGGALARPCVVYPSIFPKGTIWEQFPFLLPNLFSAICVFFGVIIGILFLEETHEERKEGRDRGLELGNYLVSRFTWCHVKSQNAQQTKDEEEPLLPDDDEQLPRYQTAENSPQLMSTRVQNPPETLDLNLTDRVARQSARPESSFKSRTFTRPVLFNIISYGVLAL